MKKPSVIHSAEPSFYRKLRSISNELRKNPTESEKILWEKIKSGKLGTKFRRQHIINRFIVDFCSIEHGLIIELEGRIHDFRKFADFERIKILENEGYQIVRFNNNEVIFDIDYVVSKINKALQGPPPP